MQFSAVAEKIEARVKELLEDCRKELEGEGDLQKVHQLQGEIRAYRKVLDMPGEIEMEEEDTGHE